MSQQGYVFINEDAEYAREGDAGGFSTGKTIRWTKDLNQATIFPNEEPWRGPVGSGKHKEVLKTCQPIKATAERIVKLNWRE